ncbi:MAG: TrkH family potassium uptake protein [Solirubrobacterales bacterium]
MRRAFGPDAALVGLTLGGTLVACGLGMLACAGIGIEQGRAATAFVLPGAGTVALGAGLLRISTAARHHGFVVRPVTGLMAVTLAWVGASLAGAVPLLAAGTFDSPLDAVFEATSGFTTTGSTLLGEIETEPDAVLLWRSIMQWLGGVGIVVLVVAIAPVSGPGVQRAFYAETSGITAERLTPRIIDTAKIIAAIYLALSAAAAIAYLIAGMGIFDAINHSMTTIATGGYSTRTESIAGFDSLPIELVAIAFMALSAVNFAFYWRAVRGRSLMPQAAEVAAFVAILVAAIAAVTVSLEFADDAGGAAASLRQSAFSATSIMTTTGYTTADFDAWNSFARVVILVLMTAGACAGSTAGGIKVIRLVLLGKSARQELDRQLQPRAVRVLRLGGHTYSEDVRRAVLGFFLVYVLVYVTGSLVMAASGLDLVTAISSVASTLNIIGPGLGEVGATENFEAVPPFGRVVLPILMIAGRLEVFTVVALLAALFRLRRR